MRTVGLGFHWDDLRPGDRFKTVGRTVTQADLAAFVGVSWMNELLFTNEPYRARESAMRGPVVPGAMVYSMAEGLLTPTMQHTGLAFLEADIRMKGPTFLGDTIHVECEVIEARATSKAEQGLVRTSNEVKNQHSEIVLSYNPLRMVRGLGSGTAAEGGRHD